MWRLTSAIGFVITLVAAVVVWLTVERWWVLLPVALLAVIAGVRLIVMPSLRYRIHRWELTGTAVFTQSGWLGRDTRIAPLSRVQTVDTNQGPLMRLFKLSSITVTTASAAGPITIAGLDHDDARRLVAALTEITAATPGDAT